MFHNSLCYKSGRFRLEIDHVVVQLFIDIENVHATDQNGYFDASSNVTICNPVSGRRPRPTLKWLRLMTLIRAQQKKRKRERKATHTHTHDMHIHAKLVVPRMQYVTCINHESHAFASCTVCVCPLLFSLVLSDVEQDDQHLLVAGRPHLPTWANMAHLHNSTHATSTSDDFVLVDFRPRK